MKCDDIKDKIGRYDFVTESYLVDFQGMIPIPMLGNYLLHAATEHAEARGFGYRAMTANGLAWVLSRIDMEVIECPRMSQRITIETWVEDVNRLFTTRCFTVLDSNGKPMAHARSVWAAIDLVSRRPTDLLGRADLIAYVEKEKECPVAKGGKVLPAEDAPGVPYRVKYSDIDVNRHLNSIKYMEHLLDLFDIEKFKNQRITRFEIVYMAEGKYGTNLSLHLKEVEGDTKYLASICDESGSAICRASIAWA